MAVLVKPTKASHTQIPINSILRPKVNSKIFLKRLRITTTIDSHSRKNFRTPDIKFTLFHPQPRSEKQVKRERRWIIE